MRFVTIIAIVLVFFYAACSTKENAAEKEGKVVVLTFDDAVKSHRTFVAPLLKKYGFGATFFVTHRWMEDTVNFMHWQDIKALHDMGFEIGNHSWSHADFALPRHWSRLAGELALVNAELEAAGVPPPVSFAYPGNHFGPEAIKILQKEGIKYARRGMQPEVEYGKIALGPLYVPNQHHPLLIPTAGDAYPAWDIAHFKKVVDRAKKGEMVVLQFHGVPDVAHDWVNTPQQAFEKYMQYLYDQGFRVIALKDVANYFPEEYTFPNDTLLGYRTSSPQDQTDVFPVEVAAIRNNIDYWLENMRVYHNYSLAEMASVTHDPIAILEKKIDGLDQEKKELISFRKDQVNVLPYPGGRHPRIGFLEGAIDPQRGTKLSIFLPWDPSQYMVLDIPEAIFTNLGLTYLAHTHFRTIWDDRHVIIENRDWSLLADGSYENRWELPNGIQFGAKVIPAKTSVDVALWLENSSKADLTDITTQVCIMLKGAPDFDTQTNDNKIFKGAIAAVKAENDNRWILTAWNQCHNSWGNPDCPCLHSDPMFGNCKKGERTVVNGKIWFYQGENIEEEINKNLDQYTYVEG